MKSLLAISLILGLFLTGMAQTGTEPKVGLVLSGGGAKGLAHIGVLRAIDEAGIKIDYIGGTSMGAIVGALYASGYTANQIDSVFRKIDFDHLIQGAPPRSSMAFYDRQGKERYALTLPIRKFKVGFPAALSNGQNVYNLLSELLFHVSDIERFEDLPIPFFCMATDVESGEAVKLDRGYLPLSIAASGAFPSLFAPFEIEGRVLIDGGVVNNYPIDEVKAMGADIVIGSDVQDPLSGRDDLNSATGILLQINNYRTVNDMVGKAERTDLYVKPDVSGFTVISFDLGDSIIANGYAAANSHKSALDSIAALQGRKNRPQLKVSHPELFTINRVDINGNLDFSRKYIRGKLRIENGEPTSFKELEQGLNNLIATGNFTTVRYVLRPEDEGYHLVLNLKESEDETLLRLGVHYDDLYQTGGLINLTKKNLLLRDDAFLFDFILGDEVRYQMEYYVDKGSYWSFGLRSRFNSFKRGVDFSILDNPQLDSIPQVNKLDIALRDFTNQIYMQTQWREEFTFGVGLEHKYLKVSTQTVTDLRNRSLEFDNSNLLSGFGYLKLDTLDDKYFPTRGLYFDGDFHLFFLSTDEDPDQFSEFSIAKAKMGFVTPLSRNLAFQLFTEGGFQLGNSRLRSLDFALGGYGNDLINNLIPFLGYDFISFGGDSFVKATFTLDWELARKHHVNLLANYAIAGEKIFDDGSWFEWPEYTGYALGYGYESFLGPVEVKYNWSPEIRVSFLTFSVGYWF